MRIHRLEISAFGPFAGTEEIDFDRLSAHGLFLLNGPTGAGKTSVLDAICYALYGSVPGARQDGKRLRSDHADSAAEPRVTCEFTARGRRFEVSRTPAWDKPSTRGRNGFTTQQAKTLLRERVAGAWVEKSGRNDEAGAEITALLGMDREQFTRVVLLPQGDFAAFLRSKASDRLDLLQKLFGTERFEAVERELGLQAARAVSEVADLEGRLALLVARARAEATALEVDPDAAPEPDGGPELLSWLESAASERASALAGDAASAEVQRRGCRERLEAGLAREDRRLKLAAALRRRADAEAAAPGLASAGAALDLHRKAELLGGQLKAVTAAESLLARAERAADLAFAGVREAVSSSSELPVMELAVMEHRTAEHGTAKHGTVIEHSALAQHAAVDVAAELSRLRSLAAVIGERLADEDRLGGLHARAAGLGQRRQELTRSGDDQAVRLLSLRTEVEALRAALEPLEQLAGESVLRTKEAAAADELVDVVRRYGIAAAACAAVTERHLKGREHHQELRRQWLDVREERLANAAAELASRLEHGAPCPVCGSPEHPEPVPAGDSVLGLAEKEERAKERSEAAERALAALEAELSEARQLVAVLAGQNGDTDPAEAAEAAQSAREAAAEAAAAVGELAASRSRQEELAERIEATEQLRVDLLSQLAQTESALTEIEGQSNALESSLETLRAGHASLALRSDAVAQLVDILEQADAARSQLDQAAARLAEARTGLDRALPEAGFASAAEARQALLPGTEAARLESAVQAGRDEEVRLEELFASEELVVAARERSAREDESGSTTTPADLVLLRTEAEQAAEAAKDIELAAGMARQAAQTLGRLRTEYGELAESGREPRERAELLKGLAEAARGSGDNSYRMSLNAYVLAARLEQVAIAASERLVAMSDGRYTLQHSDARAARNAKSGLGLEVVDEWTGRRRDTSTLSGGESFMASLSLALGLADVVQQEAGGVDIETLFVDEGFGSLDEQALEQVMDALEGLRDGGRVVGLVSHVGEMKQRIGSQLQVVKQRNGSTVHIVDALVTV
ncbi:SMC family ATPase [Arthrobacter sp. FW305-BF8]|uniref:AAA family ATPase n=1 Tax=Arthrobacter sp. FW305-BF8 TaxID=2879617 RepID=UPI001F352555|nr:SMC family ATPase [Arthrobacter sp. FW305-BF8]UKA52841.1 SMC family ATPase [Arthrobacter sp. FW305-BF8]